MGSIIKDGNIIFWEEADVFLNTLQGIKIDGEIRMISGQSNRLNSELNVRNYFFQELENILKAELEKRGFLFNDKIEFYHFVEQNIIGVSPGEYPAQKELFLKTNNKTESLLVYWDETEIYNNSPFNIKTTISRKISITKKPLN